MISTNERLSHCGDPYTYLNSLDDHYTIKNTFGLELIGSSVLATFLYRFPLPFSFRLAEETCGVPIHSPAMYKLLTWSRSTPLG